MPHPVRQPKDLPQHKDVWHAFVVHLRTWITEPDKKPMRPFSLLILNLTDGTIVNAEIAETPTPDWVRKTIVAAITRPGHGRRPYRPRRITLANPYWVTAMTPPWPTLASSASRWTHPTRHDRSYRTGDHMRGGHPEVRPAIGPRRCARIGRRAVCGGSQFHRAPWVKLVNAQALAIRLSTEVEPSYVSVMGNAGIEYGLSISRTWADFQAMASGSGDGPMDAIPPSGLHSLLFNSITDIPFDDLEALEKHHWQVAHADACPMPIVFEPPDRVLRPSRDELLWYQAVLRAVPVFVRDHLRPDGQGDYAAAEASIAVSTSEGDATVVVRYGRPSGSCADPAAPMIWSEGDEEEEPPVFDRRMMEGQMAALTREMGGEPLVDSDLEKAQHLMYSAWEERNAARRIALAHEALSVSPDCADAYVLLAEEEADTVGRALEYYRRGVEAGERALGEQFDAMAGYFWGVLETRPYMRSRQGLADTLWRMGRKEEACSHYKEMLRLNPNDNQGLRYLLVALLLEMDRDADVENLLKRYKSDASATWYYTRALVGFRASGATDKTDRALRKALKYNPHVLPYLIGQKRIPNRLPDTIGFGDENEAIAYAADHLNHWRRTDGAVDWLRGQMAAPQARKPSKAKQPTLDDVVESIMADLDGPISLSDLVHQVLAQKPSRAKDPAKAVMTHLRDPYGRNKAFVFVDRETVLPLRLAMEGVRFRITLDRQMVSQGSIALHPYFVPFLRGVRVAAPPEIMPTFETELGREIPASLTELRSKPQGVFGELTGGKTQAFEFKAWLSSVDARRGDSLLLTVVDWEQGRFQLAFEPERRRRKVEVARQNQVLADQLCDLLKSTINKRLWAERGLEMAYARLPSARDYPGDHWTQVVDKDKRLLSDVFEIVSAEAGSGLLSDLLEADEEAIEEQPFTARQGKQVYRFRARRGRKEFLMQVQGNDTLGDLDAVMREAFGLEMFDHLAELSLIVSHGKQKQAQSFGVIDPAGEHAACSVRLAGLGLAPGAHLEYLYDLGDATQFALLLEAIEEPEAKVRYPRYRPVGSKSRKA
jgi:tetratricopeptide (TPR) repeat protein